MIDAFFGVHQSREYHPWHRSRLGMSASGTAALGDHNRARLYLPALHATVESRIDGTRRSIEATMLWLVGVARRKESASWTEHARIAWR
ncbi:hypothetical protein N7510_009562 [Penicillium lagena]|uniref:uncharacterized protein n=1 Tax=Penicillium lagena TaxID=94218 RepID=UPI002540657F|nr:uncharacterized protein N7510_009562 [Penicillium lagena]KAJ5604408.1 hypothetical protein N7510_009562 [Penicillium lagena]